MIILANTQSDTDVKYILWEGKFELVTSLLLTLKYYRLTIFNILNIQEQVRNFSQKPFADHLSIGIVCVSCYNERSQM